MTRRLMLLAAVLVVVGLLVAFYPAPVEKLVKDGPGANAISVAARYAAPPSHSPLEQWQTHHMDALNRGDLKQADCLYCHEPQRGCNNCHSYVGVASVDSTGLTSRQANAGAE